ncbi:MAG: hypothetical protein BGO05_28300 [Rhizobiales bacterium 63-7]|nr:MAG: hypothetical protein BGO05_28300 [Rhizobiales bacterium 63-7]
MLRYVLALAMGLLSTSALGEGITPSPQDKTITFDGEITARSPLAFKRALDAAPWAESVVLNSPGGFVQSALLMAEEVKERKLSTVVPDNGVCVSACAFIFLAGEGREVKGQLGVHQIYGLKNESQVQVELSDVIEALNSYGVAPELIPIMLRTAPDGMHMFSREEITKYQIERATIDVETAFLYEEKVVGETPFAVKGEVRWTITAPGANGNKYPKAVATISMPGKAAIQVVTFLKNEDRDLPASHVFEFLLPPDGSVKNVVRVAMKETEQDKGNILIGVPADITKDFKMFALNDFPKAVAVNTEMLRKRNWLDIPVTYTNGNRALVTIGKGRLGAKAINAVLDAE